MNRHNWRIIKNSEEHSVAIKRLLELASGDLQPGTGDFDEFELLGLLIEHYEKSAFPMDKPDPIEAIKYRMDQQGLSQNDMKKFLGSASKVSEVLSRKKPLSLTMIKRIHDGLGIPLDVLIQNSTDLQWGLVSRFSEIIDTKMSFQDTPELGEVYSDFSGYELVNSTEKIAPRENILVQEHRLKTEFIVQKNNLGCLQ